MRIAYLAAGAAGMVCGSCLHDNTLAAALMKLGEDVVLLPTYTPLRTDEINVSSRRVFFGGINVYLEQQSRVFRRLPRWLDRWLAHPALLNRLSGKADSVDAAVLGELTNSMLAGSDGNQAKEVDALVDWLKRDFRPDVVHLSNSMLTGVVTRIKEALHVPVICTVSGEDIFLEKLPQEHYSLARDLLRRNAQHVDAFVALNDYFANYMADYLMVPPGRMHVIPHGLVLTGHSFRTPRGEDDIPTIGYLARICPEKGLHVLIGACEILAQREVPFRLVVAGYLGGGDRNYMEELTQRVRQGPLRERFDYAGEIDRDAKLQFLRQLDVFSMPTVYRESKGIPVLEAWANGVPVVVPEHGTFPELVADTEGGLLHRPEDSVDLADKLAQLLEDEELALRLARQGHVAIHDRYHADAMAQRTRDLYRKLMGAGPAR